MEYLKIILLIFFYSPHLVLSSMDSFFNGGSHSKDHPVIRFRQEKGDLLFSQEDIRANPLMNDTDILSETEAIEVSDRMNVFNLECTAFYPIKWSYIKNSFRRDPYSWNIHITNLQFGWPTALGRGNFSSIFSVEKGRGGGFPGEYIPTCHGIGEILTTCLRTTVLIKKGTDWVGPGFYDRIYNFTTLHSCQLCQAEDGENITNEAVHQTCPITNSCTRNGDLLYLAYSYSLVVFTTKLLFPP